MQRPLSQWCIGLCLGSAPSLYRPDYAAKRQKGAISLPAVLPWSVLSGCVGGGVRCAVHGATHRGVMCAAHGASWFYCRIQLLVLSQRWVFTAQLARDTRVPFIVNTSNTQLAPLNTFFSQRAHSVVRTHSRADMHETRMFRVFVNTQHALLDTFFSTRAHSVGRTHSLECEWKNARTRGMSRHQLHS